MTYLLTAPHDHVQRLWGFLVIQILVKEEHSTSQVIEEVSSLDVLVYKNIMISDGSICLLLLVAMSNIY